MADTLKTGGIQVDGLTQSIRVLGKLNPQLKREAIDVFRDAAKLVQSSAQSKIGNHPSYRLGKQSGMIGRSATAKGAGVRLRASKYPWALAGEFGERWAHYYGNFVLQSRFKRRTAAPFKPPNAGDDWFRNTGGYWIQPAMRKLLPQVAVKASRDLTRVFEKAMRSAGVKGG